MIELVDWTQVVACPIRPPGSWGHLMLLVLFVVAARWMAPERDRSRP
ncbi:MAG: hypothetical protein JRG86_11205 [Deltaproteobacteria bacterium]|jgi:hypothetical protein|nr:hypothetical protein [Deltaproteobacteria bacterium]MBW2496740.1 hypothetical protein [Deltaproteobacteria bacterium]